jgi:hypothetical protein
MLPARRNDHERLLFLTFQSVGWDREVLQERTRERVPLDWAATQNNLGNALMRRTLLTTRHSCLRAGL